MRKMAFIMVCISLLLTGCWDYREVDRLAAVLAIGIDCIPGSNLILLTAQIASSDSKGGSKQTQGQGGDRGAYTVMNSEGKSLTEAIYNLSLQSPRRILLTHCKLIVMGKQFAECDINEIVDQLKRSRELRPTDWMLTTDLTAKEILEKDIAQEHVPARGLDLILENFDNTGNVFAVNFNDFMVQSNSASHVSFTPLATLEDIDKRVNSQLEEAAGRSLDTKEMSKLITFSKTAVFKNLKMVGILNEDDTRALKWLVVSPQKSSIIFTYVPQDLTNGNKGEVSLKINEGTSTIIPHISEDGITMNIDLNVKAFLQEIGTTDLDLLDPKVIEQLQIQAAESMKLQLEHTINTAQKELKIDYVGFADIIHNYYPVEWKQINNNWDDIFPSVNYQISCEVQIYRTGMVTDSTQRSEPAE